MDFKKEAGFSSIEIKELIRITEVNIMRVEREISTFTQSLKAAKCEEFHLSDNLKRLEEKYKEMTGMPSKGIKL